MISINIWKIITEKSIINATSLIQITINIIGLQ